MFAKRNEERRITNKEMRWGGEEEREEKDATNKEI